MIYIFVFILLIIYCVIDNRKKSLNNSRRLYLVVVYWIFVLLAGLRYMIGGDTQNYHQFFLETPQIFDLTSSYIESSRFQTGFILFTSIVKTISQNFALQQFIHALFINYLIFLFIRDNSRNVFAVLLIYFILNYIEFNTEIMRESMAVSLGLLSYNYLKKNNKVCYFICVICAYSFHISAMILLLYPILYKIRYTNRSFNIIFISIIILPFVYMALPNLNVWITYLTDQEELIDQYVVQEVNTTLNYKYYFVHLVKYALLPFVMVKILHRKPELDSIIGYIYAYVAFQSLGMFSYGFYRFANYFAPFYWILIGCFIVYIFDQYARSEYLKIVILMVISVCMLILYQNHQLIVSSTTGEKMYKRYIPYNSIISPDNSYKMSINY